MSAFKKVKHEDRVKKLNQKVIDSIMNNLRAGAYIETAVICAGVSKPTFYAWLKTANEHLAKGNTRSIFVKLLNAVERAQEESEMRDLLNIDQAAMGAKKQFLKDDDGKYVKDDEGKLIEVFEGRSPNWTASAWRLERKNPQRWGRNETHNLKSDDGSVNVNFVKPEEKT